MADNTPQDASSVEKVVIIGSGPAGWTAALYAARANLNPIVFEGEPKQDPSIMLPGGQLMLTTEVENFPGYPDGVQGPQMMDDLKKQALRFDVRAETLDVTECDFSSRPFTLKISDGRVVKTHTAIISTGANAKWLGLDNEMRLAMNGGGVSACAVCDGALPRYRDQPLAVVGGGDTAMEEASHLAKYGSKIYIIHRRNEFRASKVMQERVLGHEKCEAIWDSVVTDVIGENACEGVKLKNVKTGEETTLDVQGLFIAIGHKPNTGFLANTGLEMDDAGYLKLVDGFRTFTNIEGVFAAGDVSDSIYRQAVTAAGMGCKAAIDAERWLGDQGIE